MTKSDDMKKFRDVESAWKDETANLPEEPRLYETLSGNVVERTYTPSHLADTDPVEDISLPGKYPFTRGIHATGYRGKLWTMRMFAGFGTPEETNKRFHFLLEHGETGLSTAFDMPTLYGYDTDAEEAYGEFGRCGVAVSSIWDMDELFDNIPLDQVTTSMTINGPAPVTWAMYLAVAKKRGIPIEKLGGTTQNDILKEYIAQNEYIFPPQPSMRLVVDTMEFAAKHMPKWNPVSVSGYHIREAGSTAVQELAFTLADGLEYVNWALERGLDIDQFAPRISFFWNIHNDFFEEVAKFRAARRVWAHEMRETYGAKNERSWWLRCHAQTAGCTLTAQQPQVNIARVALQAFAAVLGGTNSLHTNSLDEAWALPEQNAALLALRTQQVIAEESGAANTVDPLGGSYFVEHLTDQMEEQARSYFRQIADQGGVIPCIDNNFFVREIADSAFRFQQQIESKQRVIVGVNEYVTQDELEIPLLRVDVEGEQRQIRRLKEIRRVRDDRATASALRTLESAAKGGQNLMYPILEAVESLATLGETMDTLRGVFGEHTAQALA